MATFNYIALDREGKNRKGVIEGDSPRAVRANLRTQGLIPLTIESSENQTKQTNTRWQFASRNKMSTGDLALFTRQLASLLESSMPVEEALLAISEQTEKNSVKRIILAVRNKVLEGHALAAGLNAYPKAFPSVYRASIAAGEQSGYLDVILTELADYTEKQQEMEGQIQQALIYPTVMTFVSLAIIAFLLTYIVPNMIRVFKDTGKALPLMTQILLSISSGVKSYGLITIVLIILSIWGFRRALRNPKFKIRYHRFLLKVPIIGKTLRTINTSRFMHTFGLLSAAGVEVLHALQISSNLVTLVPIYQALQTATLRVREGTHIYTALKQTGYFPPMSIHLIASGEKSGQLSRMLQRAAQNQQREVQMILSTALKLFEPLMILLMGGIVLFIVLAILLPIFEMNQMF